MSSFSVVLLFFVILNIFKEQGLKYQLMYELNCTLQIHLGANVVYMLTYLTRNFIL